MSRKPTAQGTAATPQARKRTSLKRWWTRAFAVLLLLTLGGGVASTLTVTSLVQSTRKSAEAIGRERETSSSLRTAIGHVEGVIHELIDDNTSVARTQFLETDASIRGLMVKLSDAFDDADQRPRADRVRTLWEQAVGSLRESVNGGASPGANPSAGSGNVDVHREISLRIEAVLEALAALEATGREEVEQQIAEGRQVERRQLAIVYAVLLASFGATVYFARRMRQDVLQPIQTLREAASRLGSGELDHRLELGRSDELGELGSAFNAMADALDADQRRLTEQVYLQARLAAIVDSSDAAIVGLTPDLVITTWNTGAERLYGYSPTEAIGRRVDLLVTPDVTIYASLMQRIARGERIPAFDTRAQTGTGAVVPISLTVSPMIDPDGHVIGVSSIAYDITERRNFETALRVSEERFRSLVQNSSDLTMVCDAEGVLRYVSPASRRMLGIDEASLTGRPVADLIVPGGCDTLDQRLTQLARDGRGSAVLECQLAHGDGSTRRAEITLTNLLDDPSVRGIVLNLRDVTDRHRLETELRHAQKLESVGQLAAGIAHEINTPIQFVGDNVRFLRDAFGDLTRVLDTQKDAPQTEIHRLDDADAAFLAEEVPLAIDQTLEGVERISTIVRAMKAFGHPSGDEKAPADLNQAVRNTLVVANNEIKYVADVVTELGELPPVWCHLNDVNQVLLNLVVNAAHAVGEAVEGTEGRGTITVKTVQQGGDVVIEVADTGVGIPRAIAERVFEPFFTTKEVGKGTGQGLTLAYSLVHDRHNGTITFQSEPGAGTTFTVRLPIGPPGAESAEDAATL